MTEMEYIKNRIREHMNQTADHMSLGGRQNYENYQHCVGIVNGLAIVEREIIDLEEKIQNAE